MVSDISLQTCFSKIFENNESHYIHIFIHTPALKIHAGNGIQAPSFDAENKEIYSMQRHVNVAALPLLSA